MTTLFLFVPVHRTSKVSLKLLDDRATEAQLDLDAVSGLTEINLELEEGPGLKYITKLGVSLQSSIGKAVPSQVVSLSPRYVLVNESDEVITIRQCNLEVSSCHFYYVLFSILYV